MNAHNNEKIGLLSAIVIGMNAMIGAGIVSLPAILAHVAGPAGVLSYGISIFFVIFMGLSLGRLALLYAEPGWSYTYPALWGGHRVGMISALCYLSGVVIAMGFLVQQAGIWVYDVMPIASPQSLSIAVLGILTMLVVSGAQIAAWGQYVIALSVIIPLMVTSGVCLYHAHALSYEAFMPYGFKSVINAASLTLFSFMGFESISSLYSIVESPQKNVPRATVISIIAVGCFYMIFAGGILFSIPLSYFSGVDQTFASILRVAFPRYAFLPLLVLIGGLFGIIGTLHSMIWSLGALLMDVIVKMRSPFMRTLIARRILNQTSAVVITSLCMLAAALVMKAEDLVNVAVFVIVFSYIFSLVLPLTLRAEWRNGKNIVAVIALMGAAIMLYVASTPVVTFISQIIHYTP